MDGRVLRLRQEVQVHDGPASTIVLANPAARQAVRVPEAARDVVSALRVGATFPECLAAFRLTPRDEERAEQQLRRFIVGLRDAGVLSDGSTEAPVSRQAPHRWGFRLRVGDAVQHRIRSAARFVGRRAAAALVVLTAALGLTALILTPIALGNPVGWALRDWSWPVAIAIILPWMWLHECAHVFVAVCAGATVTAINVRVAVFPPRLRMYVSIDPRTIPIGFGARFALPAAGPIADLVLLASTGAVALSSPRLSSLAMTAFTVGGWLSAATLAPIGETDMGSMVRLAERSAANGVVAPACHRLLRAVGWLAIGATVGVTVHGAWTHLEWPWP